MRATVYHAPRDVRVEQVPDPNIQQPKDAIVRITHACICGSDLWPYRGIGKYDKGWRLGHELMGVVEDVGSDVFHFKKGDYVLAPFVFADGTCEFCKKGLPTSCLHGAAWGTIYDGGQGEAVRSPFADATLIKIPADVTGDDKIMKSILPLTDVMGTGHHAALKAGVKPGVTAAVVGDGAVGLCGVLAAKRLGAARIIVLGHRPKRLEIAKQFGATDVVNSNDEQAIKDLQEMTKGGAEAVLECVGTSDSMNMAIAIARPGGFVGYVGAPAGIDKPLNIGRMFLENIGLRGGVAPVHNYIPELLKDVLAGKLDPAPVLDMTVNLDGVPAGYKAMDQREAIKVMVKP